MPNLKAKKASAYKHVMLFGPPFAGKTTAAGKVAEKKKLLWIDIENGFDTLFKLPDSLQENIELIHIPDTRVNPMAIETVLKLLKGSPVQICEKHGKVGCPICSKVEDAVVTRVCLNELGPDDCLVLDSMTQLTNSAIASITKNQPIDYKLEFDDWHHLQILMDTVCSAIQAAPYNVIVISHENQVKTVGGGEKIVPVAGSSKFSRNTAKYFNEVVYCEVRNGKHTMSSGTTWRNNVMTGSGSGVLLEKMAEPSLLALWEAAPVTEASRSS